MSYRMISDDPPEEAYGIVLIADGRIIAVIPDISDNKDEVESLTRLLNELKVEPCHFEDVVEDYLTDFTI